MPTRIDHRPVIVMGFNYERGYDQMLHSFGHRAEFLLAQKFNSLAFLQDCYFNAAGRYKPKNEFEEWLVRNGTVHTAPGLTGDYAYPPTQDGGDPHEAYIKRWLSAIPREWWQYTLPCNM